jgi:23S rRNA (pseudouridine1915-N3)-methyltransferase
MKIKLICVGKTEKDYVWEGIDLFVKKLKHYVPFEMVELPSKTGKSVSAEEARLKEGVMLLELIQPGDKLVLLDERGTEYSSVQFSAFLQKEMNSGLKTLYFVVGGPFGFDKSVYVRANAKISLSQMTFTHQMVRLFFVEQLYRAFTILKNEKYHHE